MLRATRKPSPSAIHQSGTGNGCSDNGTATGTGSTTGSCTPGAPNGSGATGTHGSYVSRSSPSSSLPLYKETTNRCHNQNCKASKHRFHSGLRDAPSVRQTLTLIATVCTVLILASWTTLAFLFGRNNATASLVSALPRRFAAAITITASSAIGITGRNDTRSSSSSSSSTGTDYDVVVIGAGPAGLTAAIFGARSGLSVLVVGSDQGQLSEATSLDNFPGYCRYSTTGSTSTGSSTSTTTTTTAQTGADWLRETKVQAAMTGVQFAQAGLLVSKLEIVSSSQSTSFSLHMTASTDVGTISSAAVIVASGAASQRLGLPYEDELWGTSVHSCAICDGSNYYPVIKNNVSTGTPQIQVVVVVGGGDAAVDAALLLARHAQVILIHRRTTFRASNAQNVQALRSNRNIIVYTPYVVDEYITLRTGTSAVSDHPPLPPTLPWSPHRVSFFLYQFCRPI